jgi:hypothetical protein
LRADLRVAFNGERFQGERHMSLEYVDYSSFTFPPQVIFAKGGGNQGGQAGGRPLKSTRKVAPKKAKKAVKKAPKKAVKKAPAKRGK